MTDNILLREVADSDLPIFFAQQQDDGANQMVAFTPRDPMDREAFTAHWAKIRRDASVPLRTILWEGQVAGYVASFEREGKLEVCYWLGRDYWGKGIATQALAALLRQLPTRPLYAGVAKDNFASIRVLEKCGFTIIGEDKGFSRSRGVEVEEFLLMLRAPDEKT